LPSATPLEQTRYETSKSAFLNKQKIYEAHKRVTDNTAILCIDKDSALNNKVAPGIKFNKRVKVRGDDAPNQEYMKS